MSNVVSTLLLVWTGLKTEQIPAAADRPTQRYASRHALCCLYTNVDGMLMSTVSVVNW